MGGDLIVQARRQARLTQAELASRAGTTQSAISRWEGDRSSPSFDTVVRLVGLCGFSIDFHLEPTDPADLEQVALLEHLTPDERLDDLETFSRFVDEGRRAYRKSVSA